MDKKVRDVQFPGPTNKIVVFKDIVFKLKYKLSDHSLSEVSVTDNVQADLRKITSALLDHLLESQVLVPLKNDYMVVYPALSTWSLAKTNKLLFFRNDQSLQPHQYTVYLLVHLFATPPPTTPPGATNQISAGTKRPHPLDDVVLPVVTGIPRNEYIVRKKLRLDPPHPQVAQTPDPSSPDIPTERVQITTHPSSETVSMVAKAMRTDLEEMSQPTQTENEAEPEPSLLGGPYDPCLAGVDHCQEQSKHLRWATVNHLHTLLSSISLS